MAEIKLIGINIDPDLYIGFTFEKYVDAYQDAANYKHMAPEQKQKALENDWAEIEKHLPKKEKKAKEKEGESL